MADFGGTDLDAFRAEAREWLEANFPTSLANQQTAMIPGDERPDARDGKLWKQRMGDKGWGAPTWPTEYGGGGLSGAAGARAAAGDGPHRRLEPDRRHGHDRCSARRCWNTAPRSRSSGTSRRSSAASCAGARATPSRAPGSDLASLQTKCEDKGDHWQINGQKIWTSGAQYADWCFCLVRTDTTKKHEGISLRADRHASAGRRGAADQADRRQLALLRDLLHRRAGREGRPGRAAERRLDHRQAPAAARALRPGRRADDGRRRTSSRPGQEVRRRRREGPDRRRRPAHPRRQAHDGRQGPRADAASARPKRPRATSTPAPPPRS